MYRIGPSGSRKTVFISELLQMKNFQTSFERILHFYKHFQSINDTMLQSTAYIELIQCVDFAVLDNLPADGAKLCFRVAKIQRNSDI